MATTTRMPSPVQRHTLFLANEALWPSHSSPHMRGRTARVPGLAREVTVEIAATRRDWEEAFHLVGGNYQSRGYDSSDACDFRFTSYHALPETMVLVAKERGQVVATMSLFMDNTLLGLPMETMYGDEVRQLRQAGNRLCEVGSLADAHLGLREFVPVFTALIRLAWQHHVRHGGDTGIITVNPRHRSFYTKVLGFEPIGERRACPSVCNHPAEAFVLDVRALERNAPDMHRKIFGEPLPPAALAAPRMPADLIRYFSSHSSRNTLALADHILRHGEEWGSTRRW